MALTTTKRRQYGSGSLILRGGRWYMRYYEDGERQEKPTGKSDRKEAEKVLKIRIGELAAGKRFKEDLTKRTVQDALELVLQDYRENEAASTGDVEARIRLHLNPKLGTLLLSDIGQSQVKAYSSARKREKAAVATINRELAALRRALKLAMEQDPPWIKRALKISLKKENNARSGFVDHQQYLALRERLPVRAHIALVIGYHAGLRISTIRSLRLDQVDWDAKVIRIESAQVKQKSDHLVPIYGDMVPYIEMALSSNRKFLCEESDGTPLGAFRRPWLKACASIGLPCLMFHDLRRSAVRNMIQAGVPESVAMKISGHRTHSMLSRYNIIAERDIKVAAAKIQEFLAPRIETGEKKGEALRVTLNRRMQ